MSQREWVQFVKDAKVPIPITEINDVFRRVDRAEKEDKKKDPKAKADKQMSLAEFLEALVRTAGKLMNTSKAGKQGLKDGKLGEGFEKLIDTYILPLGERDSMAEWRKIMESDEVKEIIEKYKEALYMRFAEIVQRAKSEPPTANKGKQDKGPGKAKGPAPKANKKENTKASAEGAELDGPAAVVRDFETNKLLVDLKVVVDNPIVGEKPLTYVIELSRMDVERGFIESQDRDEAMLAIITGNVKLLENANELDYEEFLKCVAFCGLNMFRNVKDMPATDRIETLLAVYVGPGIEDMTSADRLRAAVKKTLSKGLERFDPDADL